MFNWQDLYYFSVVARTASLSAAARELKVEHATVGRRLDALEKALGLTLVDRLPRSRPLTAHGQALARLTEALPALAAEVERLARVATLAVDGTVRVSAPPSLAAHCIAPRLAGLRAQQPGLNLVLLPGLSLAALDKGEADLALRTVRPELPGVMRRRVGQVRFGLYAAARWCDTPEAQWCFIAYDPTCDHLPQQAWLHRLRGARPVVFAAGDLASQQMAARAGVGALVLPTFIGDHDPALKRLPVSAGAPARDLWLTAYPDLRRAPAVKAAMAFLLACVEGTPELRLDTL